MDCGCGLEPKVDGSIVLTFIVGAFTEGCTEEICTFRDELDGFESVHADVYGISVNSPVALWEYKEKHDLRFDHLSDLNRELIAKYDVVLEEIAGLQELAQRAVFVIDEDRTVVYEWVAADPTNMPAVDEVKQAAKTA